MIIKRKKKVENNPPLLNKNILFSPILLISEEEKKIVTRQEALNQAQKAGLDLLCVAPSAKPPVCKLVNYYQINKKRKKKKEKKDKEVNVSFNIEKNDLEVKLNKIHSWIEKGSSVKVNLVRKGKERSPEKHEIALEKCHQIITELQNQFPKIELKNGIRQHLGNLYFFLYKKKQ